MFKFPELTNEQKERAMDREAQEVCERQMKEEEYRRKWCIEQATMMDETRPENICALADKIYAYVWGPRA